MKKGACFRSVIYNHLDPFYVVNTSYQTDWTMACYGPGQRPEWLLHYVLEGKGKFNGIEVCAGQGFYSDCNGINEFSSDEEGKWSLFHIGVSKELAEKYILKYVKIDENGIFSYGFNKKLIVKLNTYFKTPKPLTHTEALSMFFDLMSMHYYTSPLKRTLPRIHVDSAKDIIEKQYSDNLSMKYIASRLFIDDQYLYNIFKKLEGISPKEYINQVRAAKAAELLATSNMTVTEIAAAVGYNDVCNFCKFFKAQKRLTPSEYRNNFFEE